jgi:hypothetical protein
MSSTEVSTDVGSELDQIETAMKTDIKAYNADKRMRSRHLELLTAREAAASPPRSTNPAAPWHQRADNDAVIMAQKTGSRVLAAFTGEAGGSRDLQMSFEGLPRAVQSAIFDELGAYRPGFVAEATPDELEGFKVAIDGGAELVARWGGRARWQLGRIFDSFKRVREGLSASDRASFDGWWNRVPMRERLVIFHGLTAGR